jgi:hypothetical protein
LLPRSKPHCDTEEYFKTESELSLINAHHAKDFCDFPFEANASSEIAQLVS